MPGGVSFNIASNLAKLGTQVSLISVFADDDMSEILKHNCERNNIDITNSRYLVNSSAPMFLCVTDDKGEIKAAISDTKLMAEISLDFIKTKIEYINTFGVCLIDGNLTEDVFEYLFEHVTIPIYVDPVSADHSKKLINSLVKCTLLNLIK